MAVRDPAHSRSIGLLVLTALCWSLGGVLIKYVAWTPLAVAGGRGFIAAALLAFAFRPLRFTWSPLQIGAALAYAGCTISFVTATKLTTAANAILLQYTAPVYVALLSSWLLGERTRRVDWLTLAVVLGGMALFFADELEMRHALGNAIAILSGVFFAAMTLLLRKQKDGSPAESIILGNLIAGVVGLPSIVQSPLLTPSGWGALALLGTVQLGLSYYFYAKAVKHVTALELVLIPVLEPILNPIWAWLAYGERPGPWAFVGGAIVLGAVTWRALVSVRQTRA
ncbi:EamA family transporter [Opitutaceae bacterium EW11]|nr:EamA family transporter [Opitutaceae bacterium EW11]